MYNLIKSGNLDLKEFSEGIYDNVSMEDYRSAIGFSRSDLIDIGISPKHWEWVRTHDKEDKQCFSFGSLVHDTLQFGDEFIKNKYIFEPTDIDKRKKEGKEKYKLFIEENKDKRIVSKELINGHRPSYVYNQMIKNAKNNKVFQKLLSNAKFEQSIFWIDKLTGLPCKCRPDLLINKKDMIIVADIKTTRDASLRGFRKELFNHNYDVQASFYSEGVSKALNVPSVNFLFMAIENKPPFDCAVYNLSEERMEKASSKVFDMLNKAKEMVDSKNFSGYPEKVEEIF